MRMAKTDSRGMARCIRERYKRSAPPKLWQFLFPIQFQLKLPILFYHQLPQELEPSSPPSLVSDINLQHPKRSCRHLSPAFLGNLFISPDTHNTYGTYQATSSSWSSL